MALSINLSSPSTSALCCLQAWKGYKLFNGFHSVYLFSANGHTLDLALRRLAGRSLFGIKSVGKIRVAVVFGEGDLLNKALANGTLLGDKLVEIEEHLDVEPIVIGFPIDNGEFDLDCPTKGFSSILEAIEDIRRGKMVVVVDDEDRENEGDLIMATKLVTPEAMAFIVKHGTGIVCVSMKEEGLERLQLPLMVNQKENEEKLCTVWPCYAWVVDHCLVSKVRKIRAVMVLG